MSARLNAALEYAASARHVIPLKTGDKVPAIEDWPNRASTDPGTIRGWFRRWPAANVGIVTGRGLAVLDVDPRHGGEIPSWAPPTLTSRTPSGGFHLYYAVDGPVPNSVGRLAPGVDVRGEGGQVAVPPSVRVDGVYVYEWVDAATPIATVDAALLTPTDQRNGGRGPGIQAYWNQIDDDLAAGRPVLAGRRNNYVVALAGWHFNQGLEPEEVLAEVQGEADRLGFTPDKPNEVVACVAGAGTKHGRGARRDLIQRLRARH